MGACTSAPSTPDPYRGTWAGTIDDRTAGIGTLQLELRIATRVEGSWTATFGTSQMAGALAADASPAAQRTFAVGCPQGSMVWATTVEDDVLRGTYVAAGCGVLSSGRVEARRR